MCACVLVSTVYPASVGGCSSSRSRSNSSQTGPFAHITNRNSRGTSRRAEAKRQKTYESRTDTHAPGDHAAIAPQARASRRPSNVTPLLGSDWAFVIRLSASRPQTAGLIPARLLGAITKFAAAVAAPPPSPAWPPHASGMRRPHRAGSPAAPHPLGALTAAVSPRSRPEPRRLGIAAGMGRLSQYRPSASSDAKAARLYGVWDIACVSCVCKETDRPAGRSHGARGTRNEDEQWASVAKHRASLRVQSHRMGSFALG